MRKSNYGKRSPMSKKAKKATVCVIGTGILIAIIAFFSYYNVDSVEVRGTSHYTDEEIKEMVLRGPLASNSVLAPMLYSTTNTDKIAFVDAFKVTQLNRNTICISVKEKKPVGCIHYLDSYIYFDRNGIFVEGSKTRDESVPYFDGIQVNKVIMDEKLDIKGDTVLNTAVALSTIFQKNDKIPDHIQFDSSYSISLVYGNVTVQLGKDENLEEKMNRVLAILPNLTGKKGILHMESVSSDMNTFEEEQENTGETEETTTDSWNGGYDEDGNYTGDGEFDENGNYVGSKPMSALEEAIANWNGGYDEEGDYTGAGEYDADGNYVGPKPTQESLDAENRESDSSDDTYTDGSDESQGGTASDGNGDSYEDSGDESDSSEGAYDGYSNDGSEDYNSDGDYSGDSTYDDSYNDNGESY